MEKHEQQVPLSHDVQHIELTYLSYKHNNIPQHRSEIMPPPNQDEEDKKSVAYDSKWEKTMKTAYESIKERKAKWGWTTYLRK